jgi:hypothetical protein
LPSIWATLEIILIGLRWRSTRGRIGSIAVETLQITAIPVNDLIFFNVLGHAGVFVLICGYKGLREVKPTIVGHIVGPFGCSIVGVFVFEGSDIVRLAIVVPGKDFNHGETLLNNLVPAVEDE